MDFMIFAGLLALLQSPIGVLVFAALLGLLPAAIAWRKGHSFWLFWLYGTVVFIVAFPHAIIMRRDTRSLEERQIASGDYRRCPHCAEVIRQEASACRFCGREAREAMLLDQPA